jgi:ribosome-binding factor A
MNYRPLRVGKLIRQELSMLLQRELEFPGTLVTVTEVIISKKIDTARVLVSILPENKSAEALRTLRAAASDLRYKLLHKLNIKPMPQLVFEIDRGPENAAAVEKAVLDEDS